MSKIIIAIPLWALASLVHAQTGTNVKTNGNIFNATDQIGSTNNEDVTFITNNQNHLILKKNGNLRLVSMDNGLDGLVFSNPNGIFSKTNLTGNVTDVLTGTGVFAPLNTVTGWALTGSRLHTNKRVGINVANPYRDLEVDGDALVSGTLYVGNIESIDVVNAKKRLDFRTSMSMTGFDPSEGTRNEIWAINNQLYVNSQPGLNINTIFNTGNTGNMGVGTEFPDAKLHVVGNSKFEGEVSMNSISIGSGMTITDVPASGGQPRVRSFGPVITGPDLSEHLPPCLFPAVPTLNAFEGMIHCYDTSAYGGYINSLNMGFDGANGTIDVAGSSNLNEQTPQLLINYYCGKDVSVCTGLNGGDVFLCNETGGGVGIATNGYIPSGYKLAVNGKLIAEDIRVRLRSTWPDYVFDTNYKKLSLDETEAFIQKNHHLPGVPSATTIQTEGFDTGEMIKLQMEKIEELTLYIIELEKRINQLENK